MNLHYHIDIIDNVAINVLNKWYARTTARNQSVKSIRSLENLLQKKTGNTEHKHTNTHPN